MSWHHQGLSSMRCYSRCLRHQGKGGSVRPFFNSTHSLESSCSRENNVPIPWQSIRMFQMPIAALWASSKGSQEAVESPALGDKLLCLCVVAQTLPSTQNVIPVFCAQQPPTFPVTPSAQEFLPLWYFSLHRLLCVTSYIKYTWSLVANKHNIWYTVDA